MPITNKHRNSLLNPAFAAAIVAIASTAALLLDDFGPSHASQDKGAARMVTAAAVSKAGATETPSELFRQPANSPSWLAGQSAE
jgi:hypothetical protein